MKALIMILGGVILAGILVIWILTNWIRRNNQTPTPPGPGGNNPQPHQGGNAQAQNPPPTDWKKIWKRIGWTSGTLAVIALGLWSYFNLEWNLILSDITNGGWKWLVFPPATVMAIYFLVTAKKETLFRLGVTAVVITALYFGVNNTNERARNYAKWKKSRPYDVCPTKWTHIDLHGGLDVNGAETAPLPEIHSYDVPILEYNVGGVIVREDQSKENLPLWHLIQRTGVDYIKVRSVYGKGTVVVSRED